MREETNSPATVATGGISTESVNKQMQKLLTNRRFAGSERHCRLLRYLLEQTLNGRADQLKEYVLGVEVFDRRDSFDPQTDPIVRTEFSRLRAKLKDYYEADGRSDAIIIDLPKRSYSLSFQLREVPEVAPAKRAWFQLGVARVAVATLLIIGAGGFWAAVLAHNNTSRLGTAVRRERFDSSLTAIAVLPFTNLGADRESEYFSDGLTEELIQRLAEVEGLRVVSRTSAFQFKARQSDLRAVAEQLNVGLVLEGTVRKSGDRLRITARLVNAADGYQLGSHVYDRGIQGAVGVQEEIARQVANTLRIPHASSARGAALTRRPRTPEAYDHYLQGRYHANDGTELGLRKAIRSYERAIAADPDFAPAHSSLADAYIQAALLYEAPPGDTMLKAKESARRAVETSASLSHAHSALASVLALYDRDWAAASAEFGKALELDPHDAGIREAYAMRYLLPRGRMNAAVSEMQFAMGLDPFSPAIAVSFGKVQHFKRDPDRAIEILEKVLRLEPGFEAGQVVLGKAYLQKSLGKQALDTLENSSAPVEDEARIAVLGHAYALSGRPELARQSLGQLEEVSRQRYVSGYYLALIHLGLGQKSEALDLLEKAAAEHSPLVVYLRVNPLFDSLRADPRFARLLRQLGLGE